MLTFTATSDTAASATQTTTAAVNLAILSGVTAGAVVTILVSGTGGLVPLRKESDAIFFNEVEAVSVHIPTGVDVAIRVERATASTNITLDLV